MLSGQSLYLALSEEHCACAAFFSKLETVRGINGNVHYKIADSHLSYWNFTNEYNMEFQVHNTERNSLRCFLLQVLLIDNKQTNKKPCKELVLEVTHNSL